MAASLGGHSRLSGCPLRHLPGGGVGRRRHLHQNALARMRHFDAALLEAPLHAAVEFALHGPMAAVGAADLADDRHHLAVHLVDAPEFKIAADRLPVLALATHFGDDFLQDLFTVYARSLEQAQAIVAAKVAGETIVVAVARDGASQ
jgi:hypothetical protein